MLRSVATIPLSTAAHSKLLRFGYLYCEDVLNLETGSKKDSVLSSDKSLSQIEWRSYIDPPETCTALQCWKEEHESSCIVTFCKKLDDMLRGGISLGTITELCGAPGTGKTNLSLQLCVDVVIPEVFGGLGSEGVFICTDSGFSIDRLSEVADACSQHCQKVAEMTKDPDMLTESRSFTRDYVLSKIHVMNCCNLLHLIAAIHSLGEFISQHPQVKLVVIDSLSFPFRHGISSSLQRTSLLHKAFSELQSLVEFDLAVVVTNQLTTILERTVKGTLDSRLIPSLGEGFGHRVNRRLMMGKIGSTHHVLMFKSSTHPQLVSHFVINSDGIRDVLDS